MGEIHRFGRRQRSRGRRRGGGLLQFGGILALLVVMGLAAGYYLVPPIAQLAPSPLSAAAPEASRLHYHFAICGGGPRVNCVIDGDTFYLDGEKIRIADINTPELFSPQCGREATLARQAQRRLHTLLNAGPVELRSQLRGRDRDVYGRKLRTVYRDGRSLGETLVAEGLAHRWRGYKESWCG